VTSRPTRTGTTGPLDGSASTDEAGSASDADLSESHWFAPLAEHLGEAYLRYSFTRGTEQETDALIAALGLEPGQRVLDVGCGPGRHALAFAARGFAVVGVDISETFVRLAAEAADAAGVDATFLVADARRLEFDSAFDAAISLCQGAFGLCGATTPGAGEGPVTDSPLGRTDPDGLVLDGMARAVRPGGRLAVSAFSSYFQVRHLEEGDRFDAGPGVHLETTELRNPAGEVQPAQLWTTGFTPRELRYMAVHAGLAVDEIWSVTPGAYRPQSPDLDHPEFLLLAHRP
jgi:SAM-dependent methyltransferase